MKINGIPHIFLKSVPKGEGSSSHTATRSKRASSAPSV